MAREHVRLTDAERKAQRRRSIAMGIFLAVLAAIFYVVAMIKMGSQL